MRNMPIAAALPSTYQVGSSGTKYCAQSHKIDEVRNHLGDLKINDKFYHDNHSGCEKLCWKMDNGCISEHKAKDGCKVK